MFRKAVIHGVQGILLIFDCGVAIIIKLQVNKLMDAIPKLHKPHDTRFGSGVQLRLHHAAVFTVIHLAVYNGIGVVPHIRVGRDGGINTFALAYIRQFRFRVPSADA